VLWILADPHGGHDPGADHALLALLDRAKVQGANLLVLGDLFTGWIAREAFWGSLERAVIDRCRALRQNRQTIDFVVGNRDYLVKEMLEGDAFDHVYEDAAVLSIGGRPTMVVHGDRTNPDDLAYHAWRRLSRSFPVTRALSLLPASLGRRLAGDTERRLSKTNTRYKTGTLPIPALEELGREALRRGASRALVGHFHHDRVLDVPNGVPVVLAPGWFEHRRILVARDDGALESWAPPLVG
jgi:UDP-2,3-diacylglucosamine hydrolase